MASADPVVTNTNTQGELKTVFGGYENAIPEEYLVMREVSSFDSSNRVGDEYQHGVQLTRPNGFTSAAPGILPNLNAPVSRQVPKAKLQGYQVYLRERVAYDKIARAMSSGQAAVTELGSTLEAMQEAMMFRCEAYSIYGQSGLATIGTVTGDVLTINSAEWAAGMWAGNEGMRIDIRTVAGAYRKTVSIDSMDLDALTLTLASGDGAGIIATDVIWFEGGSTTTEPVGIKRVLQNTTTLYNIDAADYQLWKGINQAISGTLTFQQAVLLDARVRSRGGPGEQIGMVNPDVFTNLISTVEAARTFSGPSQYSPVSIERGTMELTFYSPVGKTTIKPHPMVKRGDYFSLRKGKWKRVGATDPTFKLYGVNGDKEISLTSLQDVPAVELRCMADFTMFTPRPAANAIGTGIVLVTVA